MAQTFGALAYGLQQYQKDLTIAGVVANKIASKGHGEMVKESLPKSINWFDYMLKDPEITLAERHLGLVQAQELQNIDDKIALAAQQIADNSLKTLPAPVDFDYQEETPQVNKNLQGKTIIVAKDLAFSFLYQANLSLLTESGANLVYTSPLNDAELPAGDALYIPGGYPELYAEKLSNNHSFINSLKNFHQQNKPILAECGGMLYLLSELNTIDEQNYQMAGLLSGSGTMNKKLTAIGLQSADISQISLKHSSGAAKASNNNQIKELKQQHIRGHSFHYSSATINEQPVGHSIFHPRNRQAEAIYHKNNLLASYMHWYFPSNPEFIKAFFANN